MHKRCLPLGCLDSTCSSIGGRNANVVAPLRAEMRIRGASVVCGDWSLRPYWLHYIWGRCPLFPLKLAAVRQNNTAVPPHAERTGLAVFACA